MAGKQQARHAWSAFQRTKRALFCLEHLHQLGRGAACELQHRARPRRRRDSRRACRDHVRVARAAAAQARAQAQLERRRHVIVISISSNISISIIIITKRALNDEYTGERRRRHADESVDVGA